MHLTHQPSSQSCTPRQLSLLPNQFSSNQNDPFLMVNRKSSLSPPLTLINNQSIAYLVPNDSVKGITQFSMLSRDEDLHTILCSFSIVRRCSDLKQSLHVGRSVNIKTARSWINLHCFLNAESLSNRTVSLASTLTRQWSTNGASRLWQASWQ